MALFYLLVLTAAAVVVSPLLVRVLDRAAGYVLGLLLFAAAAPLAVQLPAVAQGDVLSWHRTWIPNFLGSGLDVNFALRGDGLGVFFALLALGIGGVVLIYSAAYLPRHDGNTSFYLIMTAFTLAVVMLVLADDAVVLFVGWELVSIASFLLIARSGSGGEKGSMRTLILTFFGGLTLLAALAIAATSAGTTNLQGILNSEVWAQNHTLTAWLAVLIAVSAFTKAAQLPFHFWLPEAMAAATPVSAFLHAAAVVKAGVYLLVRFSGIFHDVAVWNYLLVIVGIVTAFVSAVYALTKTDLKKLTAYSTVSHLGWIVATIGIGTRAALIAALVHTLAHALFKSSLFMLIGVVDHEAGTRDTRRLGVIWKKMPFTFGSAAIAAASMAAVPPLFGFVSKEGMLAAFEGGPFGTAGTWLLLTIAGVAALFTFLYSAKYVFGAFVDKGVDATAERDAKVHEAPVALWLPAALPGLLSIPLGLYPAFLDNTVESAVTSVAGPAAAGEGTHLALWHGINVPLMISVLVLVVGIILVLRRHQIFPAFEGRDFMPSGNQLLHGLLQGLNAFGKFVGSMANSLNPSRHLIWPVLTLITLMLFTLLGTSGVDGIAMAPRAEGLDNWQDLFPFLIITISVVGLMVTRHRLTGAVLIGTVGVGITFQMLILGAPDVALTQFLVEALVVVIMMMVLRYQPSHFKPVPKRQTVRSLIVAVLAGLTAFLGVFTLLGRRERSPLAMWFIDNAPEISGGQNIVATIIVEFRALDTLGELSVLGMAAIVIGAVVNSMPRMPFAVGERPRPFGQSMLNSVPLKKGITMVIPVLAVLSVLVFFRGHNDPGGGFVAALIAGAALMLTYLAKGRDSIIFRPSTAAWLTGIGIVVALASGFLGLAYGSFLYPIGFHVFGQHMSSSLIFDGGIYLAVLGMLTQAINSLGGYLKPGAWSVKATDYFRADGSPLLIDDHVELTPAFPEPIEPNPLPADSGPDRVAAENAVSSSYTVTQGGER
ncbi:DUF4040 family protein [Corynebacterium renale]|uniref:Multisubunit sodium/proton antiporter MrpA subunit /multisubunit sodium/proton antiporter MrpB subunit n=1 Tax=Corynebacterium renale TaxID=1724 RepID=A0A2A9DNI6_9CORY|nr:DUF4040 family protein [Corynebacterium renale]PFG27469.1 multisubunit sodium/proton antiporter MrpA subunit /multisubunit sodium/proton antiporter MrpB subunit [Corynebacterium renale]SQI23292.1 monovalent cation/H+ antiporter subunit A [Corynebacterium renale]